jgi:DNA topoisomerase-1
MIDLGNVKSVLVKELMMKEMIKHPPSRYNEASLVKELEKIGIGRPSTYANMISKIQDHGYVEVKNVDGQEKILYDVVYNNEKVKERKRTISLGKEKGRLVPTESGIKVTRFMMEHFPDIMDYQFTAHLEEQLDDIAEGKVVWHTVLRDFNSVLDKTLSKIKPEKMTRGGGNDEEIGKGIYYVKTKYGMAIKQTVEGKDVFVSVKEKPSLEEAKELITGKNKSVIKTIDKYTIKNGEYGPYIQVKVGKGIKFFAIKGMDPEKLTAEDCKKICETKKKIKV